MPISEVYNENNIEGMKRFKDLCFDLALEDPPYGINAPSMKMGSNPNRSRNDGHGSGPAVSTAVKIKGRLNSGGGKLKNRLLNSSAIDWDNQKPSKEYFDQLFRLTKNQVISGGNYFIDNLYESRCWVVWDKCQPWPNFSQVELAWTSFDMPAKLFKYSNTGGANHETKFHPTQKPVKWYEFLLHHFAKPGNIIVDFHMGSQSSRIAAYLGGFDYYGWESNKDYFEEGNKRFKRETSQSKLFI